MNLFRIRGIRLAVHYSFFLLLAFFAQQGWQEERMNGMLWSVATTIAFFTCVVLHELGHSFTAMHFGINVRRILLMPIGGMAEFDDIPRQPARELLITVAGPAVNFVIAGLLWKFVPTGETVEQYSLDGFIWQIYAANLVMGTFNFLPAFPMDGGRILRALLALRFSYLRATFWAATIGKVLATAGIAFALSAPHLTWGGKAVAEKPLWLLAALFAFIFFVGELEYRAVKRREADDAHWRAVLALAYRNVATPPAAEPPVITR